MDVDLPFAARLGVETTDDEKGKKVNDPPVCTYSRVVQSPGRRRACSPAIRTSSGCIPRSRPCRVCGLCASTTKSVFKQDIEQTFLTRTKALIPLLLCGKLIGHLWGAFYLVPLGARWWETRLVLLFCFPTLPWPLDSPSRWLFFLSFLYGVRAARLPSADVHGRRCGASRPRAGEAVPGDVRRHRRFGGVYRKREPVATRAHRSDVKNSPAFFIIAAEFVRRPTTGYM